jgi:hypothetical protein
MRKYQARFWRAAALVRESPTLILNAAINIAQLGVVSVNQPEIPGITCLLEGQLSLFPASEVWDKAPHVVLRSAG